MMIKKSIILTAVVSTFIASSVFAAEVDFPVGQTKGSFNCTASDSSAKIKLDTHSLKAEGFCKGEEYVSEDGHINDFPAKKLNKSYFQIEKSAADSGSVSVTASNGDITCTTDHGDKDHYGNGHYC